MTTVGLEPTIFGSEDRRLIHWATRPLWPSVRFRSWLGLGPPARRGLWAPERALVARCTLEQSVCGLVVRIAGFHPAGPGSIPGSRMSFFALRRRTRAALDAHSYTSAIV